MEQILDKPSFDTTYVRYGGFWIRFVAALIDGVLVGVVNNVISFILFGGAAFSSTGSFEDISAGALGIFYLISIALPWLYAAYMESSANQATLGKMAVGLKVVTENGERLSFANATGRHFGKILSALVFMIGYISAAFDSRKQAWHDKLAGTLVVYK